MLPSYSCSERNLKMNSTSLLFAFLLGAPLLVSSQVCEHLEIIPHPQWCSAFFLCRFGFWTVLVCPGGLMYNPETRKCDLPENVDCINDPELTTPEWTSPEWTTRTVTWSTPSVPTFSTPSVPTFSTPSVPTFSTPEQPTTPTWTTPSIPTWTTPSWTTPSITTWTTPSWTTPTIPTWTTSSWTTPTRPSIPTRHVRKEFNPKILCNDSTLPSTLPHPICQYFYKCINGIAIEMKCEDGLVWNVYQEYCDDSKNTTC